MSSLIPARHRPRTVINIVPLIDVLIVLIFFILMTMQFRDLHTLDITPPKMETAGQTEAVESISVAINPAGNLFFNDAQVTEKELEEFLLKAAETNKHQSVLVLADQETALKYMTSVMDASRKAGLEKVRLQVKGQ